MKYGYYDIGESIPTIESFQSGAHILVVRNPTDYISRIIQLENSGWEVRDCIKVLCESKTLQVGLLRKPFKGTVANNVLTNGCGGINIDSGRIKTQDGKPAYNYPKGAGGIWSHEYQKKYPNATGFTQASTIIDNAPLVGNNKGRFPSNVILENTDNIIKQFPVSKGKSSKPKLNSEINRTVINTDMGGGVGIVEGRLNKTNSIANYGDKGSASRYFFNFTSAEQMKEYLTNLIKV